MNYLITGASGFVGGHLVEAILKEDPESQIEVIDLKEPDYYFIDEGLRHLVRFIKVDLTESDDVRKTVKRSEADFVIHLAAFSSVAYSWQNPVDCFKNNANIFLNLLEAVRYGASKSRILSVGSSEQYRIVSGDKIPLKETCPPNPVSPYAVARVAQEHMAGVYTKGFNLNIVSTRSFNHLGPRQDDRFVLSNFAKQVVAIKKGMQSPVINVGDLSVVRDFIDVRDVVKAYIALLKKGETGEAYNVCSGVGRSLKDCLDMLIKVAGVDCEVKKTIERTRPVDNPLIVGDNIKIRNTTGWFPQIPFETALKDLYHYWEEKAC
jgi:GDP-4-dehydro-6-deoxy-D-mannose reductase